MSTKDAAHYLNNPDELTTLTDAQLEALAYPEEVSQGDTASVTSPTNASPAAVNELEGAPIQTVDGKHVIPHSVLAAEREARANAQAQVLNESTARVAAEARVAELQALLDAQKANPNATVDESVLNADEDFLAEMREDFPSMAKMYDSMRAELNQIKQMTVSNNQEKQQAQQIEVAKTSQELIDANPKLAHLQATNPDGWMRAVELDNQLRTNPATKDLPVAERFVKAAAAYEAIYGAIPVQAVILPVTKQPALPQVPLSMGQIPGGAPPAVDDKAALAAMDGGQALAHFGNMTKAQIEAQLDAL